MFISSGLKDRGMLLESLYLGVLSFDAVLGSLGISLGVSGPLSHLGLNLLGGTLGGQVGIAEGFANGLLGTSDVLVGGVGESVGHHWLLGE